MNASAALRVVLHVTMCVPCDRRVREEGAEDVVIAPGVTERQFGREVKVEDPWLNMEDPQRLSMQTSPERQVQGAVHIMDPADTRQQAHDPWGPLV